MMYLPPKMQETLWPQEHCSNQSCRKIGTKKGIKSLSKLFSLTYLSPASIKELNENPSAQKCVHFINLIVILSKDRDIEEYLSSTNVCRHDLGKMTRGNKEVKEQGKEEDEMETDMEVEEVIEEEESERGS
nr:hypothetical protein [Tanacetum cinerariifolium]